MGTLLAIAGAATDVTGKFVQAHEEKKAGRRAEKTGRQAQDQAQIESDEKVREIDRRSKQLKSDQLVNYLKSGVRLAGSPLDILSETQRLGDLDIESAKRGGHARAVSYGAQGKMARKQRDVNAKGLMLSGLGKSLSGAGAAYGAS